MTICYSTEEGWRQLGILAAIEAMKTRDPEHAVETLSAVYRHMNALRPNSYAVTAVFASAEATLRALAAADSLTALLGDKK